MKHVLTAALIATALVSPAKGEQIVCSTDENIMLAENDGNWSLVTNQVTQNYVLRIRDEITLEAIDFDTKSFECERGDEWLGTFVIQCDSLFETVLVNTRDNRIVVKFDANGYLWEGLDHVIITATGTCFDLPQ